MIDGIINLPRDITQAELHALREAWSEALNSRERQWVLNSYGATFVEMARPKPKIPAVVRRARARAR